MHAVKVWDLPTRIVHWALVVLIALAWVSGEDEGFLYVVHTYVGYVVLTALVFRFAWGAAGNEHARFSSFVRPWAEVRAYALRFLRLAPPRYLGHNPLGGWMVVALLLTLLAVTVTGLVAAGKQPGALLSPFVPGFIGEIFGEIHEGAANVLLLLVLLHVAGVLLEWLVSGDNVIAAMIDGRKKIADDAQGVDARGGGPIRALLLAAAATLFGVFLAANTTFP